MKLSWVMVIVQLMGSACVSTAAERHPEAPVRKLYDQVVARHPLGIPKGGDRAAIWPSLSKRLTQSLDAAQSCEADYMRHRARKDGKPDFGWLEAGLFSGSNEEAIPAKAVVEHAELQKDGSFRVYVKLTYRNKDSRDPANVFQWEIAAKVISEGGQFVVDDILLLKDDSREIKSRLSDYFSGCDGSHWIGPQGTAK